MTSLSRLALLWILVIAGCRGPKSTPEDTMDSYFDAMEAHDADALVSMTVPSVVKKFGADKVHKFYAEATIGMKSLSVKKEVSQSGDTAQAQCELKYVWRVRGENPEDHDEYQPYYLKKIDGKWYVDVPGNAKIQPW